MNQMLFLYHHKLHLLDHQFTLHHLSQGILSSMQFNNSLLKLILFRIETPTRQGTPSLLKKASLTPSSAPGTNSLSAERSSHTDSWRTYILLQAINELWLSHITPKESSTLQSGSPQLRSQISILQVNSRFMGLDFQVFIQVRSFFQPMVFLPSVDHLRAVRIVTKHLHYFANSVGPNIISGMDELKR